MPYPETSVMAGTIITVGIFGSSFAMTLAYG